ncbi:MAG: Hsp70 family protein, partial [Bacillota bacterium]|nr:Hsp70 family protein [Bacillota bacterium]
DILASYFIEQHGFDINSLDNKALSAINKQAELCKYELSNNNSGRMSFTFNGKSYETTINRSDYEKLSNNLLVRLRHPVERALRDAELMPMDLDSVILIGGATRMHIVRSAVSKMFGRLPNSNINPDEAVALGAAIQVALKERNEALNEVILTDVCPYSLGVNIAKNMGRGKHESGYFLPIIERNTPIPVSRVETLTTVYDNQSIINVEIYQGESRRVENNINIGELNIDIDPEPAGSQLIDVRYTYDINGILEVEVITRKTGAKKRIVIEKSPGSMTPEEIEERLETLKNIKIHPRERTENKLLLARGERIYEESLGEVREYISRILQEFESVMYRQNELEIRKAAEILKKKLDELEARL